MAVQLKSRQTGMSFMGIVLVGALLVSAFAVFLQLMPVMSEHSSVKSAVKKAALAPTATDARAAFDKIAAIENIKSINSAELDISSNGSSSLIKYAYQSEIHLAGPAYLTMKYSGQSN